MKIGIVGPGAIGCLLAAYLSKAKEEVWVIDYKKERAENINKTGISLTGLSGEWHCSPKARSDVKGIGIADLAILCVKSYDTRAAIAHSKPLIGENTSVLTLQNGIDNIEIISEAIGGKNIIAGVTNMGATLLDTGKTKHAGKGETIIGRVDGKITAEMRSIRELFNKVGLEMRISKDIKPLLWSKLIINSGINALTAITGLKNGRLTEFEGSRRILREAVTEATRIVKRKRIKLIYDDPLAKVEAVCEATAENTSSMLQDVLGKKRTEIDFINGVIVRLGQELGIPTPTNTMLVDLVKTIEASYNLSL
ncbi:MAG: 2-dehydropantoate 2-reductase [Candidatus Omnitrophota bacterium]